jgi:hypothetical protein
VPVPVALVVIVGGATVSLPWNVPLKGTWRASAAETASGGDVNDVKGVDGVPDVPIDWTDVGLVGDAA